MPNQPPLNPDALDHLATVVFGCTIEEWNEHDDDEKRQVLAPYRRTIETYLAVAQPVVNSAVESFVNQRPEYVTVLKNTRSGDDMSDYCRWQGHAEARRQLAQKLGWTVPHNPGETTRPEVKP